MHHPSCDCSQCENKRPMPMCPQIDPCCVPCMPPKQECCPPPMPCMPPKQECCPPPMPCKPPKPKFCPPKPCYATKPKPFCPVKPVFPQQPCMKPCPPKMEGVLLQKIVAKEQCQFPCLCTPIRIDDLPCHAKPPFQLIRVQQSGAQPSWTPLENHPHDGRLYVRVCVPVCCQVKDACGDCFYGTSAVEIDCSICPPCHLRDCFHHNVFVTACIALLCPTECMETPCFHAQLQATLDLFLIKPEPCMMPPKEPLCPPLPLYPQPPCC